MEDEYAKVEPLMNPLVLAINPGSTSTKLALYRGEELVAEEERDCSRKDLDHCKTVLDQVPMRTRSVTAFMEKLGVPQTDLSAIAARGGPLKPSSGGVYLINDAMLADAKSDRYVNHVSRIACIVADAVGRPAGVPGYVVDPVSTDEYDPISRISGMKECPRLSLTHALNMRAVAKFHAKESRKSYDAMNLITAHLGGGISIAVHRKGRMIDSVDANGEGPFSPERSGGLRVDSLAAWVSDNGISAADACAMMTREGGLMSHLGTADAAEVERRIDCDDAEAELVYRAMAYSISKHVCALAAAVNGRVDGVLLTGGLARSGRLTGWIRERVGFLGPVTVFPGEMEMIALCRGALSALNGEEEARIYA